MENGQTKVFLSPHHHLRNIETIMTTMIQLYDYFLQCLMIVYLYLILYPKGLLSTTAFNLLLSIQVFKAEYCHNNEI